MADRQDDYHTQIGDGYATYIGGINRVSTDAQGYWWGGKGMGTMPHALIQIHGGDVLKAADSYRKTFPNEKVTALIDYHNNVVEDSLRLARYLKEDTEIFKENIENIFVNGKKGYKDMPTKTLIDIYLSKLNEGDFINLIESISGM
jgi:nicotinic acid phosphoribosyltransferase